MFFAKKFYFLSACLFSAFLVGCVNQHSEDNFDRNEAVKARVSLALAYLEQNDFAKAYENIDKAMRHNPQHYLPHSVLAYYFQKTNDPLQAEKSYQNAIKLSKKQNKQPTADVLNNYGAFLCSQQKFTQAYEQFELALNHQQAYYHQADSLENIALCAKQANDQNKFKKATEQLAILDPNRLN